LENLRHIREQAGYSQQDLADESGVSQHTISEIELGRRKPQGRTLRKLAKVLDVQVADLYGEVDYPKGVAPTAQQRSFYNHLQEQEREERREAVSDRAVRYLHSWTTYLSGLVDQWIEDTKALASPGDWHVWIVARDGDLLKLAEALESLPDPAEVAADGDQEELDERRLVSEALARMGRFLQSAEAQAEAVEPDTEKADQRAQGFRSAMRAVARERESA
jgi:transcriptional regulator with XRE-family HTH domain